MNKLLLSILFILILGILLVAFILEPTNSTKTYWFSVSWVIFLVSANWVASAAIITGVKKYSDGIPGSLIGSLPAINILLFVFSIFSIILLTGYNTNFLSSKIHLVSQIILIVLFSVLIITTAISAKGAGYGMGSAYTKRDFLEICRNLSKRKNDKVLSDELKETINYISYKMIHPAKLDQDNLKEIYENLESTLKDEDDKKLIAILNQIRSL